MDVYISGKISGKTQQEAEADFGKYAEIIQAAGHTPVNPMKNGLPFDAPWEDHMERDLEMLRASDAICLLPDWVESCGAKIELRSGCRFSMTRIFVCTSNKPIIREFNRKIPVVRFCAI